MIGALLSSHKWSIALAVLLSIASATAGVSILALIEREIAHLASSAESASGALSLFALAIAGVLVFGFLSQAILSRLSASVVLEVRGTMLRRLLGTAYEQVERIGGHKVYATMTDDVSSISRGLMLFPQLVSSAATVCCCASRTCSTAPGSYSS